MAKIYKTTRKKRKQISLQLLDFGLQIPLKMRREKYGKALWNRDLWELGAIALQAPTSLALKALYTGGNF